MHRLSFSAKMARAVLDGHKTVTRRIGDKPFKVGDAVAMTEPWALVIIDEEERCISKEWKGPAPQPILSPWEVTYQADYLPWDKHPDDRFFRPRNPLSMPASYSRLHLRIVDLSWEWLADMEDEEEAAAKEGFQSLDEFQAYWGTLHNGIYNEETSVLRIEFEPILTPEAADIIQNAMNKERNDAERDD